MVMRFCISNKLLALLNAAAGSDYIFNSKALERRLMLDRWEYVLLFLCLFLGFIILYITFLN